MSVRRASPPTPISAAVTRLALPLLLLLVSSALAEPTEPSLAFPSTDGGALADPPESDAGVEVPTLDAGTPAEPEPDAGSLTESDGGVELPTLDAGTSPKLSKLPKGFTGVIGRVTDARTGEGLIEATVKLVAGGKKSALTDLDGYFRLKLPPGTYDLRVFYELYEGRRISNVEVKPGEALTLDVELKSDSRSVQEVLVEAKVDKRNESALLQERKKAVVVSDAIGAQEIARTPDANAGEAVKRVVSATVVDGRYVYLRGLGGRYALTLLNGTLMPSPEPDEPSVPLDLFPSALVSDLNVLKTYSPELPASFGGGTLVVDTSSFPTKLDARVKVQVAGNSETTFRPRVADPQTPVSELFGFADGSRALPAGFPTDGPAKIREGFTRGDRLAASKLLPNTWSPTTVASAAPDVSVSAQLGDTVKLGGDKRLGFLVAAQWSRKELSRRITTHSVEKVGDTIQANDDFVSERGSLTGSTSVLANVGLQLGRDHEVSVLGLMVNNAEAQAIRLTGEQRDVTLSQESTRIDPTHRQLIFGQLRGFHRLTVFNDMEVSWQGNYARAQREQNDIRDFSRQDSGQGFLWADQSGSGDRFFLSLVEESAGGTLDITIPLAPRLKGRLGGLAQYAARDFSGRRIRFINLGGLDAATLSGPAEGIFTAANLDTGTLRMEEATKGADAYQASQLIFGGYTLFEWNPASWLRAQAGARYEGTRLDLVAASPFSVEPLTANPAPVHRGYDDVVPSANVTLSPQENLNVRLAYAYTLARPTFRELGPFLFYDYIRRRDVTGNEDLVQTRIHHADARVEWFPGATDVFAATVFYKKFERPIERLATGGTGQGGGQLIYVNTEGAHLVGGEFEARTDLGRIAAPLRELRLGANLALVYSQILIAPMAGVNITNQVRPLQGQSPWVVNAFLQWNHEATGTELGVFYNVNGARISEVGTDGIDDFYEQPFHQLDLVATQKLPAGLELKATVGNVLDSTRTITSGNVLAWSYKPGIQFQLALGWKLPNDDRSSK